MYPIRRVINRWKWAGSVSALDYTLYKHFSLSHLIICMYKMTSGNVPGSSFYPQKAFFSSILPKGLQNYTKLATYFFYMWVWPPSMLSISPGMASLKRLKSKKLNTKNRENGLHRATGRSIILRTSKGLFWTMRLSVRAYIRKIPAKHLNS